VPETPPQAHPLDLIGRDAEFALIQTALDAVGDEGSALVLRGEAGIGKSALLGAARAEATDRGLGVLAMAGAEVEADLPYAGLHWLLRPLLGGVDELPAPQRAVLLAAFGVEDHEGGDVFLVGLGVLGLLTAEAARRPLLVTIDDFHWLDAASREVITFVGRRIGADPIVLVAAVRDGHSEGIGDLGLPEHVLGALAPDAAAAVLDARWPDLAPALRQRLLDDAAGNPLALVELATTADQPGMSAEASVLPISARLERSFGSRLADMGPDTAALLLVVAADVTRPLADVLAAGEIMLGRSVRADALEPAFDAGLLTLDGVALRFWHPLVGSAIYQSATPARRRATHAALAKVVADQPDRCAHHRAAAAAGPDEEVAAELEAAAERARRRGAAMAAWAAFARAAALSTDPWARGRRSLKGAAEAFEVGRVDLVGELVAQAREGPLSELDAARAEWLTGIFDDGSGPGQGDPSRVLHLAEVAIGAADADDGDLAVALLLAAALRTWWGGPPIEVGRRVAAVAEGLPGPQADAGRAAAMAIADPLGHAPRVEELVREIRAAAPLDARSAQLLGQACHCIFDNESAAQMHVAAAEPLRKQGRLALLAQTLAMSAVDSFLLGDWGVTATAAGEAVGLAEETGQPIWLASATGILGALAGVRGEFDAAHGMLSRATAILDAAGTTSLLGWLQFLGGVVTLSAGRYEESYADLMRLFDPGDRVHHRYDQFMAVGIFVDAALGCGKGDDAREVVASLGEFAGPSATIGMRIGLLYAEPLLAPDAEAEGKFLAALAGPCSSRLFERARLQLAYGMWLRRQRRIAESREPLRLALNDFDTLGASTWGDRARQELRAAGVSSTARRGRTWDQLSAQELQIAQLAAAGAPNREIGQRLFISESTVEYHLKKAFRKLGVNSRVKLHGALPPAMSDQAP
jgi:DNA-binding CsgD family transcriptional regulator